MNLTIGVVDKILLNFQRDTGLFSHSLVSKSFSLLFLFFSLYGSQRTEGCGDVMKAYRLLSYSRSVALFGSEFLLTTRFSVTLLTLSYVSTVAAGYICLLYRRSLDYPLAEEPAHG